MSKAILGAQGATGGPYHVNTVSIGGGSFATGGHNWSGIESITLGNNYTMSMNPYIRIHLVKAHGGTIVQCSQAEGAVWENYIIPDSAKNFDKELGKIISMQLLKG